MTNEEYRELREMVAEALPDTDAREIEERIRLILKTTGGFPVICRCGAHVYECRTMKGPIVVRNENGSRHVCPKPAQV
jgi:hypothetical protein